MIDFMRKIKGFWFQALLLALVCAFVLIGVHSASVNSSSEGLKITEKAIHRALVQCYAIEGAYPPDIAYLEDNYGVMIDHDKYFIYYDAYAQNIIPDVVVTEK
jgi:hypothetical protein